MQESSPAAGFGARPLLAVTLKMISVAAFVGMSTSIKLTGIVPAGQIVFYRSLFAVVPILIFLAFRGELSVALKTNRPVSHIMRGVVGVASMFLGFFGLTRLPLPEAITLNYAQPLVVVAFSALFLGERVRLYRWMAVVVGLAGVVIIAWPKLTLFAGAKAIESSESLGVLAILVAAVISAVAMLLVRGLVVTERSATIVLWFSITCAVASLASLPFGWAELSAAQVTLLITAGLCGGVGQILMTESYRHGDMSIIAPFEYTSMLLGIVVGYFVFNDIPTVHMIVGGAILVGAGIFIIWREHQLGLERGKARPHVPPQG